MLWSAAVNMNVLKSPVFLAQADNATPHADAYAKAVLFRGS